MGRLCINKVILHNLFILSEVEYLKLFLILLSHINNSYIKLQQYEFHQRWMKSWSNLLEINQIFINKFNVILKFL